MDAPATIFHAGKCLHLSSEDGRYGDAVAVSRALLRFLENAPIDLHSIHGIYSLDTGLHSLTKTIGTITDFWHYIR